MPHKKEKPFPWRCPKCLKRTVVPDMIDFSIEVRYEGRLHEIALHGLAAAVCSSCQERVFTSETDDAIRVATRAQLRLLTPEQIETAIRELGLKQKDLAARLGVAEETISRWANGSLLQTRAMDNLLRAYFALPQLRAALTGSSQDPEFGAAVLTP
ncbi:MAG TPA: type II TA system antitoxin MqsA family protein [Pirellulales bacterium]